MSKIGKLLKEQRDLVQEFEEELGELLERVAEKENLGQGNLSSNQEDTLLWVANAYLHSRINTEGKVKSSLDLLYKAFNVSSIKELKKVLGNIL